MEEEARQHAEMAKANRQKSKVTADIAEEKQPVKKKKGLTLGEQKEYAEIEAVIASKEGELKVIQLQMSQNATDYDKLRELTKEEQRCSEELERLMDRWAYLEENHAT